MTASEREALVARVREQLEHWDSSGFEHVTLAVPVADLRALCDEVELLRDARDAGRMLNDVRQAGLTRLTAEVERLTRERDAYAKAKAENDERFMLERDAARAEVERLREDAARLDYMDAQRNWTRWMGRDTGDGYTVWPVSGSDSFRAAIDAARTTGGRDA